MTNSEERFMDALFGSKGAAMGGCESVMLNAVNAHFSARHPAAEGWIVRRIDPEARNVYNRLLPSFLNACCPASVRRMSLSTTIGWTDRRYGRRVRLTEPVPFRAKSGLSDDEWFGELEFDWEGSPVHYLRLPLQRSFETVGTWIAAKNLESLERLWRELRKFDRRWNRRRKRTITFLGGLGRRGLVKPRLGWESLILEPGMAEEIRRQVESFFNARRRYRDLGIAYRRGFLFAGPPGVGKTHAVKVIAATTPVPSYTLPLHARLSDTELKFAFRNAEEAAPSILILEDLEKIVRSADISLSYLLNLLDGIECPKGILVLATSNESGKLDPALLQRPSRFDRVWHFGLPGLEERRRLIEARSRGAFSAMAAGVAARSSEGFSMAYVQEIVVGAFLGAISENRKPEDGDLLEYVQKLRKQAKAGEGQVGRLAPAEGIGFVPTGAALNVERSRQ